MEWSSLCQEDEFVMRRVRLSTSPSGECLPSDIRSALLARGLYTLYFKKYKGIKECYLYPRLYPF